MEEKIRKIIRTSGFSAMEIGEKSGIGKSSVYRFLNDETAIPFKNVLKILNSLGYKLIIKKK